MIRLRILHFEVSPETARHKGLDRFPLRMLIDRVNQFVMLYLPTNRLRPLGHFAIAGVRKVDLSYRLSRLDGLVQSRRLQPLAIVRQCLKKVL